MKKILMLSLALACMNAYASEYQVRYKMDSGQATVVEKWMDLPTEYGAWISTGSPFECTSRTPLENTITLNTYFNQSFSGCKHAYTRTARTDQQNSAGTIRTGPTITENQVFDNYSYTAQGIGTKPLETFTDLPTVYTNWTNVGSPTNCTTKSPLENTIDNNTPFTQTLAGCSQQQSRTARTDQQGSYGTLRTGQVITENKTLTDYTYTAQAIGTKVVNDCDFSQMSDTPSRWSDVAKTESDTTNYGYILQWKGTTITSDINSGIPRERVSSYTAGGYVYTRSVYKDSGDFNTRLGLKYFYYQVCRSTVQ